MRRPLLGRRTGSPEVGVPQMDPRALRGYFVAPPGYDFLEVLPGPEPDTGRIGGSYDPDVVDGVEYGVRFEDAFGGKWRASMMVRYKTGPPALVMRVSTESLMELGIEPVLVPVVIRTSREFRMSPIGMWSPEPIDERLAYLLRGSREALFESQAAALNLSRVPSDELPARAVALAKEFLGTDLDFSPESLRAIDDILKRLHWREETPAFVSTVRLLGSYVGEVFLRRYPGHWVEDEEPPRLPLLRLDVGEGESATDFNINVMGKVLKQITHCRGDEVQYLFMSVASAVDEALGR